MKHLRIEYNGIVLFDDEVSEVSWQDTDSGVTVTGKTKAQGGVGVGSIFDLLSAAAKKQNEDEIAKRKQDFAAENLVAAENTIDADQ